jgi:hypothetical protein
MLSASIKQRPVGQGGLCEGAVDAGGPPLRWVYDCGSNQSEELKREVARIGGDLDLLFLSHLDADHINGIDLLLGRCTAAEVILPYLTDEARILVLSQAVAEDRLTGQFADFMGDMAGWFQRRGVRRITFVRGDGGQDGGETPGPDAPDGPSRDCEGRLKTFWSRPFVSETGQADMVRMVDLGAYVGLTDGSVQADWIFLPFVHPPSKKLVSAFDAEVSNRFPGQAPAQVVQAVWTAAGREQLRHCYDALWSTHNLVSMSLYAGPVNADGWSNRVSHHNSWRWSREEPPGWLTTGDADLSGRRRRDAFRQFYGDYLDKVAVLVVPHHGAHPSWHGDVLKGLTRLKVGCAAAGANGYGHPHSSVIDDVNGHPGASFWQVGEATASALKLTGSV